ncbi:sugar kinase [Micromonospora sp. NPDC049799]|uniref:sugar kinase n=1 Tax=Micromonospora sp. NPDC049799 TaxID=3154741 RepID=UPI0033DB761A
MTDRPDVVGFGEAMVLLQPPGGNQLESAATLEVHVAGAEFNLCAAVARLGLRAAFCSRVGRDPFGTRLLAEATALGIATDLVKTDPDRPTGLFLKDIRPDGRRRVHYYRAGSAAAAMDASDAVRLLASRPRVVAVSGITAALGPGPLAAVTTVAGQARQAGSSVALDPNLRPALGPVRDQAARLRPLLPYADHLILGVDEAGPLFGVTEPGAVFAAAAAAGAGETVLKAGERGCFVLVDGTVVHLPSDAHRVVDPVGAGDAFRPASAQHPLSGPPRKGSP